MNFYKISILLGLTIVLVACSGLNIESSPTTISSTLPSSVPEPSSTIQPTAAIIPTETLTSVSNHCSQQTIPADYMGSIPPELYAGKLIAYSSDSEQNSDEIYVSNWDGQNKQNITNHPASDLNPIWSPDGKDIAFQSNRNSPLTVSCNGASDECMYELFVINPDGSGLRQITKGWTFHPTWSPDGKRIAFLGAFKSDLSPNPSDPFLYDIFVVNSDGSNVHNLTNSPGYYGEPLWSPNGKRIAFHSGELATYPKSINIINSDGISLSAFSDLQEYEMVWASDGNFLLFASQSNNSNGNDIYRLKTDLSGIEQLTFTPDYHKDMITLSPDGKWLAYHSGASYPKDQAFCDQIRVLNTATLQDYFVYNARDIEQTTVDENGNVPLYSTLSISGIVWNPDNSQLLFRQYFQIDFIFGEFSGVFTIRLDGTGLKHVNDGNGFAIQP